MAADFGLSKWYFDCVAHDGEAVVVYVAKLRWRGLSIGYASLLRHRDGKTAVRTCLTRFEQPTVHDDCIAWDSGALGVSGTWRAQSPRLTRTILDSDLRSVGMGLPAAVRVGLSSHRRSGHRRARLRRGGAHDDPALADAREDVALGALPCASGGRKRVGGSRLGRSARPLSRAACVSRRGQRDRAGRGRGRDHACRRGRSPDGSTRGSASGRRRRDGALGDSQAFQGSPGKHAGALRGKWRSRGVLVRADGRESTGWAIHEVVRWP